MNRLVIIIFSMLLLSSCSEKEENFIGLTNLTVNARLQSSSGFVNQNLTFNSGYIWISEFEFRGNLVGQGMVTRNHEQFVQFDFATGIANPSNPNLEVPMGDYTNLELSYELRDEDAQPSIVLNGVFTNSNNQAIPVRFEFNSGETFELESNDSQIAITANDTNTLFLVVNPSLWFNTVSDQMLENATTDATGTIVISDAVNEDIFDVVADRLDESTEIEFE